MSTLATAPGRATPEPAGAARSRARRVGLTADVLLGAALAAGLALIVFVATGGTELGPNTWVEIALIAVGAGGAVAVVVLGVRGRPWGAVALILFAALTVLTYVSIAWSVQPADSWTEANRTLSYLAAFGAALALTRLAPERWAAVVGAVGTVAVVVCGYALLTKVFPGSLNAGDSLGRLRAPFDYWNATGLMAALGLPVCLWAGARPVPGRTLRALSVPGISVLVIVLILSYSRGALIAAVVGLGLWFALVPLRLRATLVLALGAFGGGIAAVWALGHHAITHDGASLAARTSAGHDFGVVLLVVLAVMALVGLAATHLLDRAALPAGVRRRIGTALIVLVAMVPVVAIVGLAASSRGLTGEVSHAWNTLTSPKVTVGNNPGRIAELSNSRPEYWSEGLKVGEHALLAGTGAAGFDTARTRYDTSSLDVAHAHSYVIETFADFGLIGIAVSLALLIAWGMAVARTLGFRGRGRADGAGTRAERGGGDQAAYSPALAAERIGLITMLAVVVTFGISSLVDWTWFIPGVTVPALACAGFLAGRGPLTEPVGRAKNRRPLAASPGAIGAAIGIVTATIIAAWFVWQPQHSASDFSAAITALSRGDTATAVADAQSAASADPVSVDPLLELSEIYSARGDQAAARQELVKATQIQPSNPETWQALGAFDLLGRQPALALLEFRAARALDVNSFTLAEQIAQAQKGVSKSS